VLETAQGRPSANQSKAEREPDLARTGVEKKPETFAVEDQPHNGDCSAEKQSDAKVEVARPKSNWDRPHVTVCSSLTCYSAASRPISCLAKAASERANI
jgi:hypothetical protein